MEEPAADPSPPTPRDRRLGASGCLLLLLAGLIVAGLASPAAPWLPGVGLVPIEVVNDSTAPLADVWIGVWDTEDEADLLYTEAIPAGETATLWYWGTPGMSAAYVDEVYFTLGERTIRYEPPAGSNSTWAGGPQYRLIVGPSGDVVVEETPRR